VIATARPESRDASSIAVSFSSRVSLGQGLRLVFAGA
jgi:hypothetical protein